MKLNIFRIPSEHLEGLKRHLEKKGLERSGSIEQDGWKGVFLFNPEPPTGKIPWIATFRDLIGDGAFANRSYYAVLLMEKGSSVFAVTFGRSHFYVRPYCDYDFGTELAKRIANEDDVAQTASRRYQGKQKKDIRSFSEGTRLIVPPGSSVDFLQSRIVEDEIENFGGSAKFGTSALLDPSITVTELGALFSRIEETLGRVPNFKLPRTLVLTDDDEVLRYDEKLIDELTSPIGTSDISSDTFDLFGVDFIFSSSGTFTLRCGHYSPKKVDRLTMKEVKEYLSEKKIPRAKVLSLKITHEREGDPAFDQSIKEAVDFICDEDRVVLRGGKWLQFNEDYLAALDGAIRRIEVEPTEPHLMETSLTEGEFNASLIDHGYAVADKDFTILKTSGKAPSEAWDLQKDKTVYAVKFGTPQKLNYVVDQASSVLELIRNRANTEALPPFEKYCLWMGYRATKVPKSLAESGSIILKQKVEAWARLCEEVGLTPVIKLSRKLHGVHDAPTESDPQSAQNQVPRFMP